MVDCAKTDKKGALAIGLRWRYLIFLTLSYRENYTNFRF